MELIAAKSVSGSENLVFTSAGDRSNLSHWLDGKRDFDLWVMYYGNQPGTFQGVADLYGARRGSKFQNLHYCYQRWSEILSRYDAIMVMDDDILIDATGLTRLFEIRRELDLWALQPAFRLAGKISWPITAVQATARLRFTNFIEMACPLFRRDKLDAFMSVYDPELVGYGVDWWFLHSLGSDIAERVAVVDEVTCINPYDKDKGGEREIDQLQSHEKRKEVWERLKNRYGIDEMNRDLKEYKRIDKSPLRAAAGLLRYFPDWAYFNAKSLAKKLVHR